MSRIAIDMDEVITDALSKHVNLYDQHFNKKTNVEDLVGMSLPQYVAPEEKLKVIEIVQHETFFDDLEVFPGAIETLEALSKEHELFITTAAMEVPNSFNGKYKWLLKHVPFIDTMNFVFCGDKSIVNADYLIDDNVRHFKRFVGKGLLFDAPHNRFVDYNPRMKDWNDVADYFGVKISQSTKCQQLV